MVRFAKFVLEIHPIHAVNKYFIFFEIFNLLLISLGTAFVVYEDIFDAKNACDHLSGFNVCNRYLVVLYYQATKAFDKINLDKEKEKLAKTQAKYGLNT
jgi:hypothetical protein